MPPKRGFVPEDLWLLRMVSDPQVSPDGSKVAFVVATPESKKMDKPATAIWVAPADGSAKNETVHFRPGGQLSSVVARWAMAGVCRRTRSRSAAVSGAVGRWGEAVAMTEMPHGISQPVWSPVGTELAFVRTRTGEWNKPEDRTALERSAPLVVTGLYSRYDGFGWFDLRRSHLFVMAVEGGEPRQITEGDWDNAEPAWSPQGDRLAFVSDRRRPASTRLIATCGSSRPIPVAGRGASRVGEERRLGRDGHPTGTQSPISATNMSKGTPLRTFTCSWSTSQSRGRHGRSVSRWTERSGASWAHPVALTCGRRTALRCCSWPWYRDARGLPQRPRRPAAGTRHRWRPPGHCHALVRRDDRLQLPMAVCAT